MWLREEESVCVAERKEEGKERMGEAEENRNPSASLQYLLTLNS